MRIEIDGTYFIEREPIGYTLRQRVTKIDKATGQEKPGEDNLGYHARITHALESYADKATEAGNTAELLTAWEQIRATIAGLQVAATA